MGGVRFRGASFWVVYRRREYGPFDYQWSADLHGFEMVYAGTKFGEICSDEEMFADLKGSGLPRRVAEIACIVLASIFRGIRMGLGRNGRRELVRQEVVRFAGEQYARIVEEM